jgi:hypothetical protein
VDELLLLGLRTGELVGVAALPQGHCMEALAAASYIDAHHRECVA